MLPHGTPDPMGRTSARPVFSTACAPRRDLRPLPRRPFFGHAQGMPNFPHETRALSSETGTQTPRFGAGLTEAEVRRFQTILQEDCGVTLSLPDAWGRAIEVLSLVELLLQSAGVFEHPNKESTGVRASSLLTESGP